MVHKTYRYHFNVDMIHIQHVFVVDIYPWATQPEIQIILWAVWGGTITYTNLLLSYVLGTKPRLLGSK